MPKGKGGKKGKKGKKPKFDPNAISEIDKAMYEVQIADYGRKCERIKERILELESKNQELKMKTEELTNERGTTIKGLERDLKQKMDEIAERHHTLENLENSTSSGRQNFKKQIIELEHKYRVTHEHLMADLKSLTSRLNALEDFRSKRKELFEQYDLKQQQMEEKEAKHRRDVWDIERKFIVGTDKLKLEMEDKLLEMSVQFQNKTQTRIAATTHRTIRENIAIDNEMELIHDTSESLGNQNAAMTDEIRQWKQEIRLHRKENDEVIAKNKLQGTIMRKLTREYDKMISCTNYLARSSTKTKALEEEAIRMRSLIGEICDVIKGTEQKLHSTETEHTEQILQILGMETYAQKLQVMFRHTMKIVEQVLKEQKSSDMEDYNPTRRDDLLNEILDYLDQADLPPEISSTMDLRPVQSAQQVPSVEVYVMPSDMLSDSSSSFSSSVSEPEMESMASSNIQSRISDSESLMHMSRSIIKLSGVSSISEMSQAVLSASKSDILGEERKSVRISIRDPRTSTSSLSQIAEESELSVSHNVPLQPLEDIFEEIGELAEEPEHQAKNGHDNNQGSDEVNGRVDDQVNDQDNVEIRHSASGEENNPHDNNVEQEGGGP